MGDRTGGCAGRRPRPGVSETREEVSAVERAAATNEGVEILTDDDEDDLIVAEEDDGARIMTDGGIDAVRAERANASGGFDPADVAHDLTLFQVDLLVATAELAQPSGAEVRDLLHHKYDEINHGRLYPNLDTLVEHGLVEKGELDRRTNYYAATAHGIEVLDYRSEWLDGEE